MILHVMLSPVHSSALNSFLKIKALVRLDVIVNRMPNMKEHKQNITVILVHYCQSGSDYSAQTHARSSATVRRAGFDSRRAGLACVGHYCNPVDGL